MGLSSRGIANSRFHLLLSFLWFVKISKDGIRIYRFRRHTRLCILKDTSHSQRYTDVGLLYLGTT